MRKRTSRFAQRSLAAVGCATLIAGFAGWGVRAADTLQENPRTASQPTFENGNPSLHQNTLTDSPGGGGGDGNLQAPPKPGDSGHSQSSDSGNAIEIGGPPIMDGNLADFKALVQFIQENNAAACAVNQLDNFNNGPNVGIDGYQDEPIQDSATPFGRDMHSPINVGNFIFIYVPDSDGVITPPSLDDSWLGVGVNIGNGDGDICVDNPVTPADECPGITKLTSSPDLPSNIMVPFDSDGNGHPCVLGSGPNSRWAPEQPVITYDEAIEALTLAFKLCATTPDTLSSPEFEMQYLQRHTEATTLNLLGLDPANFELFPPVGSTCDEIHLRGLDNNKAFPDGLGNDDIEIVINKIDSQVSALFPTEDYLSVTRYRLAQLGMTLRSDSTGDLSNEDSMYTICALDLPQLEVTKQVRCEGEGDDAWRDAADLVAGVNAEFRIEVSNAGNVPLSVTLTDTLQSLGLATVTVDQASLSATMFRPSDGPGVPLNAINAAGFGLNPQFFTNSPNGFLAGVANGQSRLLGTLQATQACGDVVTLGDRVVLTFKAAVGTPTAFCGQPPASADIRNSIVATGDPDIPANPNGNEITDAAGGAPDTPRERLRGGDDNIVNINARCRDISLLKEVRLGTGPFTTGDVPLSIPSVGGPIQIQYRYTVQNPGELPEDVTLSDLALCQHAVGVPGITVSACPLCEQPTPGELTQLVAAGGSFQTSCSVQFATIDALRSFLTLDNGQDCQSPPGAGDADDCYRNCATASATASPTSDTCINETQLNESSSSIICNRVCTLNVTNRVRCILDGCQAPTQFGPFVDNATDPLAVAQGSCVQYEIDVQNISPSVSMCRIRLQDILTQQPTDIAPINGSTQLIVNGSSCPVPACFNTTGTNCEINPASCPAFTGGVFGPGQNLQLRFSASIPNNSNPSPPDPVNTITVDGAADCPAGTPAYSCTDNDSVELDVRGAGLRCDSKQWQAQSDTDADCDPDAPFGAFTSSIDLRNKVFPVILNLKVSATNTGQVPLQVTAQDSALNTCVNTVDGVAFVGSPVCELGTSKLVQPGASADWQCQIRIDTAAAARAMDTCDGALDGAYDNTASVSGVTVAGGTNMCVQGVTVQGTTTCSAEVLLPPPCDIDVFEQVKCKTDPDSAYGPSTEALPGTTLTYRLRVTNSGTTNIPKVCIADDLSCSSWVVNGSIAADLAGTSANACLSGFAAGLVSGARTCYSFGACRPAAPWIAPGETLTITFDVAVPNNFNQQGVELDCANNAAVDVFSENCTATPPANGACSTGSGSADFNVLIPKVDCDKAFCVDTNNDGNCEQAFTAQLVLPDSTVFPITVVYQSKILNIGESVVTNARICDPELVGDAAAAGFVFVSCDYCEGGCDGDEADECVDVAPLAPDMEAVATCRIQVPSREAWMVFASSDVDNQAICYRNGSAGLGSVGTTGVCASGVSTNLTSPTCTSNLCIPIPPPRGGCCLEDGRCLYITEDECDDQDGFYHGDDEQCLGDNDGNGIDDLCEQAIPTVSEWGLIILGLLLLIAGKLQFGQSQVVVSAVTNRGTQAGIRVARFPLDPRAYAWLLPMVVMAAVVVLMVASWVGYEATATDGVGGAITVLLLSYFLQLWGRPGSGS